jgi:hypothetical protein
MTMPSANGQRQQLRRVRSFYRLLDAYYRVQQNIGWAGLFLLLLLFAANHRHGWFTR